MRSSWWAVIAMVGAIATQAVSGCAVDCESQTSCRTCVEEGCVWVLWETGGSECTESRDDVPPADTAIFEEVSTCPGTTPMEDVIDDRGGDAGFDEDPAVEDPEGDPTDLTDGDGSVEDLPLDVTPDPIDDLVDPDVEPDPFVDGDPLEDPSADPAEDPLADPPDDPDADDVPEDPSDEWDLCGDCDEDAEDDGSGDLDAEEEEPIDAEADAPLVPLEGFGAISGECGVLEVDDLLTSSPLLVQNHIDFSEDPYDDPEDRDQLTEGGVILATTENAGGSSACSELFAYEVLYRCELADLTHTETQIFYDPEDSKMTDMRVEIDGIYLGVSVTRAVLGPGVPYTYAAAENLLRGKLSDIHESTANVREEWEWTKQILHVIAYSDDHGGYIAEAYEYFRTTEPEILGDTIVVVTISDGMDDFLYYSCPLDD